MFAALTLFCGVLINNSVLLLANISFKCEQQLALPPCSHLKTTMWSAQAQRDSQLSILTLEGNRSRAQWKRFALPISGKINKYTGWFCRVKLVQRTILNSKRKRHLTGALLQQCRQVIVKPWMCFFNFTVFCGVLAGAQPAISPLFALICHLQSAGVVSGDARGPFAYRTTLHHRGGRSEGPASPHSRCWDINNS